MDMTIICLIASVKPSRASYTRIVTRIMIADIFQAHRIGQVTRLYALPCEAIATEIYQQLSKSF